MGYCFVIVQISSNVMLCYMYVCLSVCLYVFLCVRQVMIMVITADNLHFITVSVCMCVGTCMLISMVCWNV